MSTAVETKPVIERFRLHDSDTGSPQVQIGLLTQRINRLSEHLQAHQKDFNSRRGLLKLVSHRRRLLDYLKRNDERVYRSILEALNLRK